MQELAEETSPNDQVQFEAEQYIALSSGRPVEDELCGVILTDHAYPRDVAIAVLDKMLEEMAVRVPKARYQGRIAQLVTQRPRDFAPGQGGTLPTHTPPPPDDGADPLAFAGWGSGCMPRLGDSDAFDPVQAEFDRRNAEGRRLGIDEPVLVAALEFPSAQEYLSRYQDLQLAQRLARNQFESRTTGGAAFGVASGRSPNKKRSFLGMRRAQRSAVPREREPRPHTLRTAQYQHQSSQHLNHNHHVALAAQASPKHSRTPPVVPEDAPLPPTPTSARLPHAGTPAKRSDGYGAQASSPRRSTLSGPALAPATPASADVASRARSATVAFGGPQPDSTVGSALIKPSQEESAVTSGGGSSGTVQESLSALRSMSRDPAPGPSPGPASASGSAFVSGDPPSDATADSDADGDDVRTPTPLAGFGAVRAALASSSPAAGRAQRLQAKAHGGGDAAAQPAEPVAPIIVERRAPVVPVPDEEAADDGSTRARFGGMSSLPSLSRNKYHTAHPTGAPTTPTLSPGAAALPRPGSGSGARPERRASPEDGTKKELHRPGHAMVAGSLRLGVPGRKRAATEGEENCIVM